MSATTTANDLANHEVVSSDRWTDARLRLMAREKELMRLADDVARERRALPWVRVDRPYVFDTPDGPHTLAELFDGHCQLIVQHFMLGPGWEEGCPSCSFMADHTGDMPVHLAHRDTAFVVVSRAPLAEIERYRRRMGWPFRWVSSNGSSFNVDYRVSFTADDEGKRDDLYNFGTQAFQGEEAPGISVFYRNDAGEIFRTYSTYGRGVEVMMGTYRMLDLTPKGRDERDVPYKMEWVRRHDRYEPEPRAEAASASCCHD